jgi:hypothetical protein
MKILTLLLCILIATPCFAGSGSVAITLSGTAGGASSSPPSFVNEYEVAWDGTTTPVTAMNAVAVSSGDMLVAFFGNAWGYDGGKEDTVTENGSSVWTNRQLYYEAGKPSMYMSTYPVTGNENLTATFTLSSAGTVFGGNILRFSSNGGVGTSNKAATYAVTLTGVAANSAIVVFVTDYAGVDGTGHTWNAVTAGSFTEKTYFVASGNWTVYGGYYADVGAAGDKTVGLSATGLPAGGTWNAIAVEIKKP